MKVIALLLLLTGVIWASTFEAQEEIRVSEETIIALYDAMGTIKDKTSLEIYPDTIVISIDRRGKK